jgi:DNA repair protein RecN (Recombination protein N)
MLLNLSIKNLALIEELRLEFAAGLTVFTGETGAGKSIILESVGLLLGGRAAAQVVRKGTSRCLIAGEFSLTAAPAVQRLLEEAALTNPDGETLLIRREIDSTGKSRAFVNDRPVSNATLAAIGEGLIDIHGQHDHQSLLVPAEQRRLLDGYGIPEKLRVAVAETYARWRDLCGKRDSRQLSEQERARMADLYRFQLNELAEAKLVPGEDEEIEELLPRLKNADKLRALSNEADQILYDSDGAVLEKLGKAQRLVENIQNLGGALPETAEALKTASCTLEEVARDLERFRDALPADPQKLEELLERQDLIHRLKRKYGQTIADMLAFKDRITAELATLENHSQSLQELESAITATTDELHTRCAALHDARARAAEKLSRIVQKELGDLGMKKARFSVTVEQVAEPARDGWDRVVFLFSANPGEDVQPLKDIASGGEMSRVMLALKTALAAADCVPVLIFDEIDAGIGGPMGQVIGTKMQALAKKYQILCITHLPQIAACGTTHLTVAKETKAGRTFTTVTALTESTRTEEIARMLSGTTITPAARKHAEEIIQHMQ